MLGRVTGVRAIVASVNPSVSMTSSIGKKIEPSKVAGCHHDAFGNGSTRHLFVWFPFSNCMDGKFTVLGEA